MFVHVGVVMMYALIALFELVVQKSAVSFVVALHAAALWLRANTKLRKAAKTRELPTPISLSTVPAPPPAPPMLKLAYGLKYEGVWRPTRMWEALVVVAVTNAMQDARLSRADAWTIRS